MIETRERRDVITEMTVDSEWGTLDLSKVFASLPLAVLVPVRSIRLRMVGVELAFEVWRSGFAI